MQGAVINVVTKQGGERFSIRRVVLRPGIGPHQPAGHASGTSARATRTSGYERATYEDFTTSLGGPAIRDRLWFFAGYQWLRDSRQSAGHRSGAAAHATRCRRSFGEAHLAAQPRAGSWCRASINEIGIDPERPTIVTPFEATARPHISAPTMNFGDLTHTVSPNTVWDVRVGRFVSAPERRPERSRVRRRRAGSTVSPASPPARGRTARRVDLAPDDSQGDPHALPARAGRRTPVEDRRTVRARRAPGDQLHSDRGPIRGQGRAAASIRLEPARQHRRRAR